MIFSAQIDNGWSSLVVMVLCQRRKAVLASMLCISFLDSSKIEYKRINKSRLKDFSRENKADQHKPTTSSTKGERAVPHSSPSSSSSSTLHSLQFLRPITLKRQLNTQSLTTHSLSLLYTSHLHAIFTHRSPRRTLLCKKNLFTFISSSLLSAPRIDDTTCRSHRI
jgi:hypothetical protein